VTLLDALRFRRFGLAALCTWALPSCWRCALLDPSTATRELFLSLLLKPYAAGQVLERPGTASTALALIAVYLFLTARHIGYEDVGLSYEQVVQHGELHRLWTAQLSHIDLLHLLLNVSALWSVGVAELGSGGTAEYFRISAILLVLSGGVCSLALLNSATVCLIASCSGVSAPSEVLA